MFTIRERAGFCCADDDDEMRRNSRWNDLLVLLFFPFSILFKIAVLLYINPTIFFLVKAVPRRYKVLFSSGEAVPVMCQMFLALTRPRRATERVSPLNRGDG